MTGLRLGYARVSTLDQDPGLQTAALEQAECDRIFEEAASGLTEGAARPELARLLDVARAGDTLVVWRLDRLGRSLSDLLALVEDIKRRGVAFASLTEGFDTGTPAGMAFFQLSGVFAEYETAIRRERQMAGIARARAEGRQGGRPRALDTAGLATAKALAAEGVPHRDIAARLGIGTTTLSDYLAGRQTPAPLGEGRPGRGPSGVRLASS